MSPECSDNSSVSRRVVFGAFFSTLLLLIPSAALGAEITIEGGGWGHGIGMSQHGAQELAEQGSDAHEIIQYFYTGATIGDVGSGALVGHADPLWIGLLQDKSIIEFDPVGGDVTLCLGEDCSLTASAGDGLDWSIKAFGGICQFYNGDDPVGGSGDCFATLTWDNQPDTAVSIPTLGYTFGRGEIQIKPAPSNRFHMVLEIGLEEYLYGIGEMPSSWHSEALGAQAIASRTYALYKAWVYRDIESNDARMEACSCHLYATIYDQKYIGLAKETEGTNGYWGDIWRAAVDATAGEAAVHTHSAGRAIEAYFFSSTGGASENNEDAWGGTPRPYLRSVSDPGATSWIETFDADLFASLLGFSIVSDVTILGTYESGAPTGLLVEGEDASGPLTIELTGQEMRSSLSLDSHYITSLTGFCSDAGGVGDDLLLYHDDGDYVYANVSSTGCIVEKVKTGAYSALWSVVEAVDLSGDGDDELVFYRKSDGRYVYYELTSSGGLGAKHAEGYWGSGWDAVEPVNLDGDAADELMFYRKSDGRFGYYNLTSEGVIGSAVRASYFGAGWTSLEPVDIDGDGDDEMMFYRKSDGRFAYYNLKSDGTIGTSVRTGYMGLNWDLIEPTDLDGDGTDEMVFYRASDGRFAAYDLNLGGYIGSSLGVGYYEPGLVSITSPLP